MEEVEIGPDTLGASLQFNYETGPNERRSLVVLQFTFKCCSSLSKSLVVLQFTFRFEMGLATYEPS